jgi:acyl-CoA thioesterase YciA
MKPMTDRIPSIKLVLLPKDTNAYGTIFGGAILSHIDLASAVEARKTAAQRYETVRIGRTSITVRVLVEAERWSANPMAPHATGHGEVVKVTEAEVVLVAVDTRGRPVPIRPEPMQA